MSGETAPARSPVALPPACQDAGEEAQRQGREWTGHPTGERCIVWELLERHELNRLSRRLGDREPGPLPVPSVPGGTDLLPQIRHIVVLMMENHSYDNYLGMLKGRGEGFPLGPDGKPDASNRAAGGELVRAHHLPSTVQRPQLPSQSWHATHLQWGGGKCDGFVTSVQMVQSENGKAATGSSTGASAGAGIGSGPGAAAATAGMGYWTEDDLPFYYGLARTFPLADHWFSPAWAPPSRRAPRGAAAHPTQQEKNAPPGAGGGEPVIPVRDPQRSEGHAVHRRC